MRAYLAKNSCSPGFWSKLAIDLRTGCLFPPLRRKLKLSRPQFADARDSRARTGLFRFRRRISDLQSSVFACARALPTSVSVRLKYMQDEFIAAADLPDVVDFAPDSLLPRWLAQLAERAHLRRVRPAVRVLRAARTRRAHAEEGEAAQAVLCRGGGAGQ